MTAFPRSLARQQRRHNGCIEANGSGMVTHPRDRRCRIGSGRAHEVHKPRPAPIGH